ncbi:MAG: type VI secretion system baseplate subunit TssK [Deltaproteobacteria bacterium]|jgi:type VI secretion system protein ImpJ|nr:type VI secretion system baseplate subunit TssK [Deltaproteobacteria bacterium]
MSYYRPIFWQQGIFLEPHHFQLMEMQRKSDLTHLFGSLIPYPWGLTNLKIDRDALNNFTFQVLELDLWLPDGRRLILSENLQLVQRNFRQAWTNPDELLPVYLAVPMFSEVAPNVNPEAGPEGTGGFRSRLFNASGEPEIVPDLLGEGPAGRVEMLYYNAFLLFGDEISQAVQGIALTPLARLQRDGDRVRILSAYSPPTLRLYQGHPLKDLLLDVLEILRAKSRQLEEYKITPAQSRREGTVGNALTLVTVLGIVCRHVARLHHLLNAPALHPYAAFSALRELAAELTVFAPGLSALGESLSGQGGGLQPYDHLDPYPAFEETRIVIARLLDSVSVGPELTLIFQQRGRAFLLDLPPWLDAGFVCWLSVRTDAPLEETAESLTAYGKLGAPNRVENLVSYNLPGIALTALPTAPVGLPRSPDTVYLSLRQSDPMWAEALKARRLALFWDQAPPSALLTLTGNRL